MTNAREFTNRLASLLRLEHEAMAEFLVALAEFDERRLWAELGHASLFSFLHRELGLSKGAAAYRKVAADLVRRYPEVCDALRDGRLCITSIIELAKVITPENSASVLPQFFRVSKREAMEIAAALKPMATPPMRAVVTAVAPAAPRTLAAVAVPALPFVDTSPVRDETVQLADLLDANFTNGARGLLSRPNAEAAAPMPTVPKPATVEPLSADLRRLHLTVSKRFLEKLAAARDALSHSNPGATTEELFEAGLDLVLAQDAKRKALVANPRNTPRSSTTDRVPADMRRAVYQRDGGRCQVPLASGGICGSTYRVQIGHYPTPRALGGLPTLDNLRLECLPHNQEQANRDFGKPFMDQFRRRKAQAVTLRRP